MVRQNGTNDKAKPDNPDGMLVRWMCQDPEVVSKDRCANPAAATALSW